MTATNILVGATVEVTGTVTSGLFVAKLMTIALQSFPVKAPVECLTTGLELITGTATLDVP